MATKAKKNSKKAPEKILKKSSKKIIKKAPGKPAKKAALKKKPAKNIAVAAKKVFKKPIKKAAKKPVAAKPVKVTRRGVTETAPIAGASRGIIMPVAGKTAVIAVIFTGVASGNSQITASLNGVNKSRTSSGPIVFTGVLQDDVIGIDGSTPGKAKISINIDATPVEFNFTGNFNDNFIIN